LFNSIGPLLLLPGTYVVGAFYADDNPDAFRFLADAETIPGVTYIGGRGEVGPFTFPFGAAAATNDGIFGPNLLADPAAIPGPLSLVLLGLGSLGVGARRWL
jgi:hypothetical protein